MPDDTLLRLAAKFGSSPSPEHYHPLFCHILDVAAVAMALWDRSIPRDLRKLLADDLQLEDAEARLFVAFLAGMHDLGKASWPFQAKDPHARDRLRGLPAGAPGPDPGHGVVTFAHLSSLLQQAGVSMRLASELAEVAGGHHGFFPDDPARGKGVSIGEHNAQVRDAWSRVRHQLFEEVRVVLGTPMPPAAGPVSNAAKLALAGLISVADWIGSNEEHFPWAMPGEFALASDPARYLAECQKRAEQALRELRWTAIAVQGPRPFSQLFPHIPQPRPLQQAVEEVCRGDSPEFLVVEAPMGEGKTEAVLRWVEEWASRSQGCAYLALPTQATANQLYARIRRFLQERFGDQVDVPLMLVHGSAELAELDFFPTSISRDESAATDPSLRQDDLGFRVAAGEWFLPRKRALLAPYGVGTIDQALLAVLPIRHVFVRLFGLAGKPVIIDEVHAYDTYMTTLLERLLEWLGALRSPVALLSATLPSHRRERLTNAYARGRGWAEAGPQASEYPRLTWLTAGQPGTRTFPSAVGTKTVRLLRAPESPEELARLLHEKLQRGGCAAVICNTVARAQETYIALKSFFPADRELGLIHARFRPLERSAREERFLRFFGPGDEERPRRFVLVGTQVLEQSLDLDFDLLGTDVAPVDLILQRMGRLHRHHRHVRPIQQAELLVRWPEEGDDGPHFDPGTTAVYDEHVLLRTWHVLRAREQIQVPQDIEHLVESVYSASSEGEAVVPPGLSPALARRWEDTWRAMRRAQEREEELARDARLATPLYPKRPSRLLAHPREEDDPGVAPHLAAVTRLAEPSVDVVILRPEDAPLHDRLRDAPAGQRLPLWLVRELLRRSIAVSARRLYGELVRLPIPHAFAATPGLRGARLVLVDERGDCAAPALRLDPELGLITDLDRA